MYWKKVFVQLGNFINPFRNAYNASVSLPPQPVGGRMEYEDLFNMLYEDGTEMTYEGE